MGIAVINFKKASYGAFQGIIHSTGKASAAATSMTTTLCDLADLNRVQNSYTGGMKTERCDFEFTVVEWQR